MVEEDGSTNASANAERVFEIAYAGENLERRRQEIESLYSETEEMTTEIKEDLTLFFVFSLSIIEEYSARILARYVLSDRFRHGGYNYLDSEMSQSHREMLLKRCGFVDDSTTGQIGNVRGVWKKLVRKPHVPIRWEEDHLSSMMEMAINATEELYEWLVLTPSIERAVTKATRLDRKLTEELEIEPEQEEQEGEIVVSASPAKVRVTARDAMGIAGPEPVLQRQKATIEEMYSEEENVTSDVINQLRVFFTFAYGMIEEHSAQLIQKHLVDSRFQRETHEYFHQRISQKHREKLLTESGIFQESDDQDTILDDIGRVASLRHKLAHQPTDPIDWKEDDILTTMETAIDVSNRLVDALTDVSVLEEILTEEDAYL